MYLFYNQGLANWGRDSMVADLIPDADSIQLVAFVQVCTYKNNTKYLCFNL